MIERMSPFRNPTAGTKSEDPDVPPANPLALDPYNPILPARALRRANAGPLALAPYSPIAPADRVPGQTSRPSVERDSHV